MAAVKSYAAAAARYCCELSIDTGAGGGDQQVLVSPTPAGRSRVAVPHDTANSTLVRSSVVVDVAAAAAESLASGLSSNDCGDDLMRAMSIAAAAAHSGRSLVTVDSITAPPGTRPALSPNCFSSFLYLLRRF